MRQELLNSEITKLQPIKLLNYLMTKLLNGNQIPQFSNSVILKFRNSPDNKLPQFSNSVIQSFSNSYRRVSNSRLSSKAFSLLETLIAASILIVVTLGIISLSNSLIVGTAVNADKTIINRWAAEGIELTQKIRDDNLLNSASSGWFTPALADNGTSYGWYKLTFTPASTVATIAKVASGNIDQDGFQQVAEVLQSDQTVGYRLICIEAVSASAVPTTASDATPFHCNTQGLTVLKDGVRTNPTATTCQQGSASQVNDLYCQMTQTSINKNSLETTAIPSGSAVKIRSVVIWEQKGVVHSSNVASLITNWRGYEQN